MFSNEFVLFSVDLGSKLLTINVPLMLVTVVYLFRSAWMFSSA